VLLLPVMMNKTSKLAKMKPFERDIKTVIENQKRIIDEVLDIKNRVLVIEKHVNKDQNNITEIWQTAIEEQKAQLQERIDKIETAIKLIDDKLGNKKANPIVTTHIQDKKPIQRRQCRYDRRGFCKRRSDCAYNHAQEICINYVYDGLCSNSTCFKRHPFICHSFTQSDCRWGPNCRYLHKENIKEIIIEVDKRNEKEMDTKESQANETIVTVDNDCKKCNTEDKCVDCIMKHCLSDNEDTKSDCSDDSVEESLEDILEKVNNFDDSNEDIEEAE
jgi:hypothetical protein